MLLSSVLLAAAATWTVEPASACHELGDRTGAEVRRACAAARTCTVAPAESAERRAILTCTRDEMIVDALARDGRRLWTLTVAGEAADRARQVAVWIARSDDVVEAESGPPPRPAAAPPPPARHEDAPPASYPRSPQNGVTVALLVTEIPGQTTRTPIVDAEGIQAAASFALGHGIYAGPHLSLERATHLQHAEGASAESVPLVRMGGRLGWGAPWSARVFGAYLDAGFGVWRAQISSLDAAKLSVAVPYVAPTVVVQYPHGDLRPYAALSALAVWQRSGDLPVVFGVSIGAGVAWSAF